MEEDSSSEESRRQFPESLCWRNRSIKRLIRKMTNVFDENLTVDVFLENNPVYHQYNRESFQRAFDTAFDYIQNPRESNEVFIAMESDEFDFDKWQESNDDDSRSDHGTDHDSFSDLSDFGSEIGESTDEELEHAHDYFERNGNMNINEAEDDSDAESDGD